MQLLDISTKRHPDTFSMVDDEDFDFLNQWPWRASLAFGRLYVTRGSRKSDGAEKKWKNILIHRIIMKTPSGMFTDHIDGNPLNNQKSNLRICSNSMNQANRGPNKNKRLSKYKGVFFCEKEKSYRARIHKNGKAINLGWFKNEKEAVMSYNRAALEMFGEFAKITPFENNSEIG